jgi:hypothetical protein
VVFVRRERALGSLVDWDLWFVEERQQDSGVAQGVWARGVPLGRCYAMDGEMFGINRHENCDAVTMARVDVQPEVCMHFHQRGFDGGFDPLDRGYYCFFGFGFWV